MRRLIDPDSDHDYLLDGRYWITSAQSVIEALPFAQPETDSFCTDCKEYDQDRHFCPRFDRVIRKTVEEIGIIHCKDCRHWD